jgi:hypothetical protein
VARETDQERLKALRAILADTASNVPEFTKTAFTGGHQLGAGLRNLLSPDLTDHERQCALKGAIVAALDRGDTPEINRTAGDAEYEYDASFFYHFRVSMAGIRLFVKVCAEQCGDELVVLVISVKRDDQAWK